MLQLVKRLLVDKFFFQVWAIVREYWLSSDITYRSTVSQLSKFISALLAIQTLCFLLTQTSVSAQNVARRKNRTSARTTYLRQLGRQEHKVNLGLAYWIELNRGGKYYKTNNKARFRSGDQVWFHLVPNADAYAYIILRQGTKGTKTVLFPLEITGMNNMVKRGRDCVVPTENTLQFDENPGVENVALLLSRKRIDPALFLDYPVQLTAYVSGPADHAGVSQEPAQIEHKLPERTKVSVEGSANGQLAKVALPGIKAESEPGQPIASRSRVKVDLLDLEGKKRGRQLWRSASAALRDSNMIVVVGEDPDAVVSVNISLIHDK